MSDRSLRTVVTDSFTAPRYVQHLVKMATGAVVLAAYVFALRITIGAGSVASVAWFLSLRVAYWLDHRDDIHRTALVKPDLWCDLALHTMPVALAVAYWCDWRVGLGLGVACLVAYLVTYPEASP